MSSLKEHLNKSITTGKEQRVDESLILSAIVCSACVAYAAGPILNTDFMKSVGAGIGGLLGGIGSMFGMGGGLGLGKGLGGKSVDDIRALLKKNPDDLTGKEKELLAKAANNPKLQKEFSNNELKKLNKLAGNNSEDSGEDSMSEEDSKELHALLKKKPEDLTPKERKKLQEMSDKYDLSSELSENELKNLKKAGIKTKNDDGEEGEEKTPKPTTITESLLAVAAAANKSEKDPKKQKENEALLDIVTASCYDDDGNPISEADRAKRMKELVGEDSWESFVADLKSKRESISEEDFESALADVKKEIKPEDAQKMMEEQKERAKKAAARIKEEKAELGKVDKEIEELQKQIDDASDESVMKDGANEKIDDIKKKIKDLQDKRAEMVNNSTLGSASPSTAKAINKAAAEKNGVDTLNDPDKGTGNSDEETKGDDEPKEPKKEDDEPKGDDDTKKKLDDAEKKWKEREKNFEDKWEKKLDNAGSQEEEDKIWGEYEKAKKRFNAAKHKELDSIDDADDHDTDNDATKKGKYKVKKEEVTDPETGKKIEVTTYTGPRGGKFYYPDGKPKTPKNKVYVHESIERKVRYSRLKYYLIEKLNR